MIVELRAGQRADSFNFQVRLSSENDGPIAYNNTLVSKELKNAVNRDAIIDHMFEAVKPTIKKAFAEYYDKWTEPTV